MRGVISAPSSLARCQTISAVHEALRDHQVDRAEARVVVVVVDVEDVQPVGLEEVDRHAVDVAAVEEDDRPLGHVVGRGARQPLERPAAVLPRQRELVRRHEHQRVLAELLEDPVHRQQRAERVAVRVLVRGQQQLVRAAQLGQHLFMSGGDAHWSSSSSVIRIPRSIDSSNTNCSVGVRFIRSSRRDCLLKQAMSRPQRRQRLGALGLVAEHAHVYASVARSGLVSTEVKVTKPMRGSLSPSAIRAERTSRTASFTLRMRSKATLMQVLGRYELAFHTGSVGKHPPHVAFDLGGPILEQTGVAADECCREPGALPQVVVRGLGDARRRSAAAAAPSATTAPGACP